MKLIDKNTKIGKIIQIKDKISEYLSGNFTVIQTFGKPLPNSILCTKNEEIKTVLFSELGKDIVIFSISTIEISEDLISWMRLYVCTGFNIYIYSFNNKKLWFYS